MAKTYIDAGSGDALVFLHGFCESKQVWAEFMKPLQQQFRTVALDLPGHGDNTLLSDDLGMESQVEDVMRQLKELGIKKCILVGHSMGGYVSLAFAAKYGGMLQGLCLFHSSALPDTDEKKENRDKTISYVERHGVANFINPFVEPLFFRENRDRLKTEIAALKEIGRLTPKASVIGALAAMRDRPDRTHVLRESRYPVLFIFGKDDAAVPLDKALEQCHLPANSMVCFLAKTGHMGMFERSYETRKALEKYAETIFG
ncbi:alpha/beta fold hydrolase [Pontibacter sp. E15-1]|uniref:alpha/beta fold hydrolase n=1 Tax=Pontibacter sp. E15-1 TaxID=2919918 RepID=UPI001F4FF089|nr:alpha/beta hydrolase [Pontibacter sp. E15-1]MCJ8166954.1 alpha/beta fold hydrolase [Pontibacter sp. E15-1]